GPEDVYVAPPAGGFVRSAAGTQTVCVWPNATLDVVCTPSHAPPPADGDDAVLQARSTTGTRSNVTVARVRNSRRLCIWRPSVDVAVATRMPGRSRIRAFPDWKRPL